MLILMRRLEESVVIDGNIEIQVIKIQGNQVHLGFNAPKNIKIFRKEISDKILQERKDIPTPTSTNTINACVNDCGRLSIANEPGEVCYVCYWREHNE